MRRQLRRSVKANGNTSPRCRTFRTLLRVLLAAPSYLQWLVHSPCYMDILLRTLTIRITCHRIRTPLRHLGRILPNSRICLLEWFRPLPRPRPRPAIIRIRIHLHRMDIMHLLHLYIPIFVDVILRLRMGRLRGNSRILGLFPVLGLVIRIILHRYHRFRLRQSLLLQLHLRIFHRNWSRKRKKKKKRRRRWSFQRRSPSIIINSVNLEDHRRYVFALFLLK